MTRDTTAALLKNLSKMNKTLTRKRKKKSCSTGTSWCKGPGTFGQVCRRCATVRGTATAPKEKLAAIGSLKRFTQDYKAIGYEPLQALAMAQLAYSIRSVMKRVEAIEAIQMAHLFGLVQIGRRQHLLSCAMRENRDNVCTCGAEPDATKKAKKG